MEYRGYDSAGIAIDGGNDVDAPHNEILLLRKAGKVSVLEDSIKGQDSRTEEFRENFQLLKLIFVATESADSLNMDMTYNIHCGIAHTRWATHGSPKDVNSHPQRSNENNDFMVVHNGIITNYREIKEYLIKKGHKFESETDTEVIAKLMQHIHDRYPDFSFRQLVEVVIQQLEGAFALAFKSSKFPGQLVATRRGSPLLIGIKTNNENLQASQFPVSYSKVTGKSQTTLALPVDKRDGLLDTEISILIRSDNINYTISLFNRKIPK
ncbi:unnamed protein product [Strongylus vulgaris]|uniref:glutamine--fructose-6-phosphate transaminase (isomerizing) n=1 Tax=Strongylus vulgaris TaxID=40348 RepID=A0A3P7LG87_STRVU|nr:unnamed protein product [Strongylus vulgaris]